MNKLIPCVIDASVLLKLFLEEEHSTDVEYVIQCYLNEENPSKLAVPDLAYIECANILWTKVRKQTYAATTANQSLMRLRLLALPTTSTIVLMERALSIVCSYDISAYDACYVALAEQLNVSLLTADAKLAQRLEKSPYLIIMIQDYIKALPT